MIYHQDSQLTIHHGDALEVLRTLPSESVNCCVTSPPYFGLRDYGVKGQIGLEETPEAYITRLVDVFREVRRVLTDDGTLWVNIGDSYANDGNGGGGSFAKDGIRCAEPGTDKNKRPFWKLGGSGISANLANCLHRIIEGGVVFIAGRCALTISAEGDDVLLSDHLAPDGELSPFFGVQRVLLKQRDNDFCQVLNFLNPIADCRIGTGFTWTRPSHADLEIVLDSSQNVGVIVAQHELNAKSTFGVAVTSEAAEDGKAPLAIEKAAEPIAESVANAQPIRNSISLDPGSEGLLNVHAVNEPVTFRDAFYPAACGLRNFRVTKASEQQFALSLMGGIVQLTVGCVGQLYISNRFGSLCHYSELYDQAKRKSNALQPKQELGIPEMLKRALMEDGWICRQTIIWHKPNPMPESVTDRCTKAHEYVFMLSKSGRYFFDADAVKETAKDWGTRNRVNDKKNGATGLKPHSGFGNENYAETGRNRRSVWTVATQPYPEAHFATYPPALIEPCILAGCPIGGVVLDPFGGSGTTAQVANKLGRRAVLIELNREYCELIIRRNCQKTIWAVNAQEVAA